MTRRPTFAEQLRKARIKANVSQSELGRMTGIHRCVITRYESGRSTPEIGNLVLLADALEVSADSLLGRVVGRNQKANNGPERARRRK